MSSSLSPAGLQYQGTRFLQSSRVRAVAHRLNWRGDVLVAGQRAAFSGKRVLDLGSHDGRFMHAALATGASHVVGVEVRDDHVREAHANLEACGHPRDRYELVRGDFVPYLRSLQPHDFDTILCFGVLSHMIEHVEILGEIQRLRPSTFILDTWVALPRWNLRERARNWRVNRFVARTQGESTAAGRCARWLDEMLPWRGRRVGTMTFLYEDAQAPGATARTSGLMAWSDRTTIEMLFDHFGFDHQRVDWRRQGIDDWTELDDYRRGARESWVARLPAR